MIADNNKMITEQIRLWREWIKKNLYEALELTPDDKLDWMPAENMLTLGQIFLHIAQTSDWWYDDFMKGDPVVELATKGQKCPPKATVKKHLDEHWERMEQFFAEPPEVLEKEYYREGEHRGRQFKVRKNGYWLFAHLLEHDIHHRCQINQYLRILGIKPPQI